QPIPDVAVVANGVTAEVLRKRERAPEHDEPPDGPGPPRFGKGPPAFRPGDRHGGEDWDPDRERQCVPTLPEDRTDIAVRGDLQPDGNDARADHHPEAQHNM